MVFMGIWNGLNRLYNRGRSSFPDMKPGYATIIDANRYAPRGAFGSIPTTQGSIPTTQDLGIAMNRYRVENPDYSHKDAPPRFRQNQGTDVGSKIGQTGMDNYFSDISSTKFNPGTKEWEPGTYLLDRIAPKTSRKITRFMSGVTPDTTQGELDRIETNRRNVQARTLAGIPETTAEQDAIIANQRQRELYGGKVPGIPKAFGYNPGTPNVGPNPFDPFSF